MIKSPLTDSEECDGEIITQQSDDISTSDITADVVAIFLNTLESINHESKA